MLFLIPRVFTAFRKQECEQGQSESADFPKDESTREKEQAHVIDNHRDTGKDFKGVSI